MRKVKHDLSEKDLLIELTYMVYELNIENATLSTLLVGNGTIDEEEYNKVYENLKREGKASFVARLLRTTEDDAAQYFPEVFKK